MSPDAPAAHVVLVARDLAAVGPEGHHLLLVAAQEAQGVHCTTAHSMGLELTTTTFP